MSEGERAEIEARLADIEGAWWGVHTSEEFHADGTSTMRYHAIHRHAGEHIGVLVETVRALLARVAALESALRLTRPALMSWDDYDRGTTWCCVCDRPWPGACPHGAACPVALADALVAAPGGGEGA